MRERGQVPYFWPRTVSHVRGSAIEGVLLSGQDGADKLNKAAIARREVTVALLSQ